MNWILIREILMPELFVLAGLVLTLLMSLNPKAKHSVPVVTSISLGLAAFYCLALLLPALVQRFLLGSEGLPVSTVTIFSDSFISDTLSVFFRTIIYFVTFIISLGSGSYLKSLESPAEYYPILLCATLGAAFLTGANDFLVVFVALETLGLSSILLAAYARRNQKSNEAGIKYLLASATATAMFLLASSFIYGLTASTNFAAVQYRMASLGDALSFGLEALIAALLVGSIAFKLAAVPFHNWSPDVYTGAPTTTTAFLSVVSKTAAFAFAIRLFATVISSDLVSVLLGVVALLSIILGNWVGLVQILSRTSIKRLLAYSSIAQAGYLLIGLVVLQADSIKSMVIYLSIYAIMNTGAFMSAIYIESETGSDNIYDLAGLITKRPVTAIAFSICLINLAGLPFIPAAFIAKFFLFATAFSSGLWIGQVLAVVGLVGSIVGLYYYLYLAKIMIVDSPSNAVKSLSDTEICCCPLKTIQSWIANCCSKNSEVNACSADITARKWAHLSIMLSVIGLLYFGIFKMSDLSSLVVVIVNGLGN